MEGKFNLGYFFRGSGITDWYKSWGLGFRLTVTVLAILFIAVTIHRAFFVKNQTQTQKMVVYPFSFSDITYAPQQQQKQEVKKRLWWLPVFFLEGYGFSETSGISDSRTGIGGRVGGRLEF